MKRVFAITFVLVLLPMLSFGQLWVARYNGPGNDQDKAEGIAIDGSGNIYVTGASVGSGTYTDYTTIKYNTIGDSLWVARYDGPDNLYDEAKAIVVDNGYIYVTGGSMDSNLYTDYVTIKYDSTGDSLWVARFNGADSFDDYPYTIAVDDAGNVYAAGYSTDLTSGWDLVTVKYNAAGVEQWVRTYSTDDQDYAIAMTVDGNGNIYVTGSSGDPYFMTWDYVTIKYDASGVEQWARRYNGSADGHDEARAIAVDGSGNVYVTGGSAGSGTGIDYTTIKYNAAGDSLWLARYNGPANSPDWANAIAVDGAGNVYVTGGSSGSGSDWDYATVKYNSSGVEQWVRRCAGPAGEHDEAKAIVVDGSYIYVTGGSSDSNLHTDYLTIEYSAAGDSLWSARYDGPGNDDDNAYAIAVDDSGYVYVTGESMGSGANLDFATIKYSGVGIEEEWSKTKMRNGISFQICPNVFAKSSIINLNLPVNSIISLKIYDVTGRAVRTLVDGKNIVGSHLISFDAEELKAGIYFAKLVAYPTTAGFQLGRHQEIKKFILAR